MLKRITSLLLSVLLIAALFASCGKDGTDGEFYYPIYSDPVSFDPQIASDNASKIIVYNCFEGLVRYGENNVIVPGVAKSWDISDDGLVYTFRLRDDTKWYMSSYAEKLLDEKSAKSFNYHVVADDFVFGLRRAFDPAMGASADGRLYAIKNAYAVSAGAAPLDSLGVEAPDSRTVRITLSEPSEDFLSALTQTAAMPCREEFFLATKGKYGLDPEAIIYNGPFYLYSWIEGVNLTLFRNENYSGEEQTVPKAVYLYINDDLSTRVSKLDAQTYDACPLSLSQRNDLKSDKITYKNFSNSVWSFCFNCKSELMREYEMRAAVCQAINTKDMELPDYAAGFSSGIVPDICTIGGKPYRQAVGTVNRLAFNKKVAAKHLDNAYRNLKIEFADINVICYKDLENTVRKIAQSWQKCLGVTVNFKIEPLGTSELERRVENGEYDIALKKITSESLNAVSFLNSFSPNSGEPMFGFDSPKLNELLLNANSTLDFEEIIKSCRSAESLLISRAVVYPIFCEDEFLGMAKGVSGLFCVEAGAVPIFLKGEKR